MARVFSLFIPVTVLPVTVFRGRIPTEAWSLARQPRMRAALKIEVTSLFPVRTRSYVLSSALYDVTPIGRQGHRLDHRGLNGLGQLLQRPIV